MQDGALPAAGGLGDEIFEAIVCLQNTRTPGTVVDETARLLAVYGIEYFCFSRVASRSAEVRRGLIVDRMHPAWQRHFLSRGHADNHPAMRGALLEWGPLFWGELVQLPQCGEHLRRLGHDAAVFGIRECLYVPIVHPGQEAAIAVLNGRHVDTSEAARIALHVIALFSYGQLARLCADVPVRVTGLSRRQADCLAWVAKGKSDWEIGEILGISEATVHWHVECAKRHFGVVTRMQAVVQAIQTGAIAP
jgi:LuxR family transcriptional regulator, quorum-sensing system regulator BjaR1